MKEFQQLFGLDSTTFGTILFGVTGGLLTLVGLIAIFISINSQHKIEKAREVIWELEHLRIDNEGFNHNTRKRIQWSWYHYKELVRVNIPILFIIIVSILTISVVGLGWGVYIWYLGIYNLSTLSGFFGLGAESILLLFITALVILGRVSSLGSLPEHNDLFGFRGKAKYMEVRNLVWANTSLMFGKFGDSGLYYVYLMLPFQRDFKDVKLEFQISIYEGTKIITNHQMHITNNKLCSMKFEHEDRRHFELINGELYEMPKWKNKIYNNLFFKEKESQLSRIEEQHGAPFVILGLLRVYDTRNKLNDLLTLSYYEISVENSENTYPFLTIGGSTAENLTRTLI